MWSFGLGSPVGCPLTGGMGKQSGREGVGHGELTIDRLDRDPRDVFEILVREHADMLSVYLRAVVRDASAVDDLFQETVLTAWRRLDDYDRSRPFGPWLRGIAHNLVLAHARKRRRESACGNEVVLARLDERLNEITNLPGDHFDEKIATLRECLEALPPPYADAIRMRYLNESSASNVADQLKISREALKKRLQRGRAQLLECLQRKAVLTEMAT